MHSNAGALEREREHNKKKFSPVIITDENQGEESLREHKFIKPSIESRTLFFFKLVNENLNNL